LARVGITALAAIVFAGPAAADVFRVTEGGNLVPEPPISGPPSRPAATGLPPVRLSATRPIGWSPPQATPQPMRPPPAELRPHFAAAADRYGLSESLLTAVAWTESRFQPGATSPAGARGVMQLMPGTARDLGVLDSSDPSQNVMGGARYLRMMLDRFGNNLELALAGYNAGPGAVQRFGGVPPFRETRAYVQQVISRLADEAQAEPR
jgi:hypothetical protein